MHFVIIYWQFYVCVCGSVKPDVDGGAEEKEVEPSHKNVVWVELRKNEISDTHVYTEWEKLTVIDAAMAEIKRFMVALTSDNFRACAVSFTEVLARTLSNWKSPEPNWPSSHEPVTAKTETVVNEAAKRVGVSPVDSSDTASEYPEDFAVEDDGLWLDGELEHCVPLDTTRIRYGECQDAAYEPFECGLSQVAPNELFACDGPPVSQDGFQTTATQCRSQCELLSLRASQSTATATLSHGHLLSNDEDFHSALLSGASEIFQRAALFNSQSLGYATPPTPSIGQSWPWLRQRRPLKARAPMILLRVNPRSQLPQRGRRTRNQRLQQAMLWFTLEYLGNERRVLYQRMKMLKKAATTRTSRV